MAYSVSPRRTLASSGGKKSEKRSTRIPVALAAAKCPNSCRMMSAAKPRKASTQLIASTRCRGRQSRWTSDCALSSAHRDQLRRQRARLAVGLVERFEGADGTAGQALERRLDDRGDAEEVQPAVEEGVDRDLVGGVEHAGRGAARGGGLARQAQAREGLGVDGLEGQRSHL